MMKSPRDHFRKALPKTLEQIVAHARLKVLILGPGRSGGLTYKKRCEVRDAIINLGHSADFYEDLWNPPALAASGLNLSVVEVVQASSYDYIVCLMASAGAIGEVHDMAREKKLAARMLICLDERHKGGYSAKGVLRIFEGLNGKVDWYKDPVDMRRCHLATRILDQIRKVAEAKQWELALGRRS
jgi:hypothetical protein